MVNRGVASGEHARAVQETQNSCDPGQQLCTRPPEYSIVYKGPEFETILVHPDPELAETLTDTIMLRATYSTTTSATRVPYRSVVAFRRCLISYPRLLYPPGTISNFSNLTIRYCIQRLQPPRPSTTRPVGVATLRSNTRRESVFLLTVILFQAAFGFSQLASIRTQHAIDGS